MAPHRGATQRGAMEVNEHAGRKAYLPFRRPSFSGLLRLNKTILLAYSTKIDIFDLKNQKETL